MLHDLNAFWPVRPGTDHTLYNALKGTLQPHKLNSAYLTLELAVATSTPGWEPIFWAIILGWGRNFQSTLDPILEAYPRDRLEPYIQANSASITIDDGLDWIRVLLQRNPYYRGGVPVWTRRALRETRHNHNFSNKDLQRYLGAKSLAAVNDWVGDKR